MLYIVWGCFHALTSACSLVLGQSFYIRAFYEDCELQIKHLDRLQGQIQMQRKILVDIVELNVDMAKSVIVSYFQSVLLIIIFNLF